MTLGKAGELLMVQAEVNREHGQTALDQMIRECRLGREFGFEPGTCFEGGLAIETEKKE